MTHQKDKDELETLAWMQGMPKIDLNKPLPKNNHQSFSKEIDLRDYFSAMAMQGLLASGNQLKSAEIISDSYVFADMMLKEREK